jgi:hypothetical protein
MTNPIFTCNHCIEPQPISVDFANRNSDNTSIYELLLTGHLKRMHIGNYRAFMSQDQAIFADAFVNHLIELGDTEILILRGIARSGSRSKKGLDVTLTLMGNISGHWVCYLPDLRIFEESNPILEDIPSYIQPINCTANNYTSME